MLEPSRKRLPVGWMQELAQNFRHQFVEGVAGQVQQSPVGVQHQALPAQKQDSALGLVEELQITAVVALVQGPQLARLQGGGGEKNQLGQLGVGPLILALGASAAQNQQPERIPASLQRQQEPGRTRARLPRREGGSPFVRFDAQRLSLIQSLLPGKRLGFASGQFHRQQLKRARSGHPPQAVGFAFVKAGGDRLLQLQHRSHQLAQAGLGPSRAVNFFLAAGDRLVLLFELAEATLLRLRLQEKTQRGDQGQPCSKFIGSRLGGRFAKVKDKQAAKNPSAHHRRQDQ